MSLIDDTCDGCGNRYDPMGDPTLFRHPELGEWAVFCAGCEQSQRNARPPSEQWWTINGECLMNALRQARGGDDPDVVYLELLANSESTDYGRGMR